MIYDKIIRLCLVLVVLAFSSYALYSKGKTSGYDARSKEVKLELAEYRTKIDLQSGAVLQLSKALADKSDLSAKEDKLRHSEVLKAISITKRPLYTINEVTGDCKPSKDFSKAFSEVLK